MNKIALLMEQTGALSEDPGNNILDVEALGDINNNKSVVRDQRDPDFRVVQISIANYADPETGDVRLVKD